MKINLFILTLALGFSNLGEAKTVKEKAKDVLSAVSTEVSSAFGNYKKEIVLGYSKATLTTGNNTTIISAAGSHLWEIKDQIQAGGEAQFVSATVSGASSSYFNIAGVGAYNLDSNTAKSIYGKAGFGVYAVPDATGKYVSKIGFFVGGGKRFQLWDHVSLSPEVRLIKTGDQDIAVEVQAFNFSLFY